MAHTFAVFDKATLDPIAECPDCTDAQFDAALESAADAFPAWAATPAQERASMIEQLAQSLVAGRARFAHLLVRESGKPLAEAEREVASSIAYLRYNAAECLKPRQRIVSQTQRVIAQPAGVVLAVTPWNYPLNTLCRKLAPALAAGCTLIAKPAPETPLSAAALAQIAQFPAGVFNVVTTTRARDAVARWMNDWRVRRVAFTGSTAAGGELMRLAANRFQKLSLELGGNAPALVFDDADLDLAAREIAASRFRHAGQTCVCVQRVFVQKSAFLSVKTRLKAHILTLRTGNGLDGVDCGPLIRESALRRCEEHVADALSRGAELVAGGRRLVLPDPNRGWFFEPTLLANAPRDALLMRDEVFGPVLAISAFDDEAQAVDLANDNDYGLVAYAFTSDAARQSRLAAALRAGAAGINTTSVVAPQLPFGGVKASGLGKENGPEGFEEFLDIKSVVTGG
jgi:succinate-semialdehyde dehydrogenase/glutarate-semialdehyde dehydrogenase